MRNNVDTTLFGDDIYDDDKPWKDVLKHIDDEILFSKEYTITEVDASSPELYFWALNECIDRIVSLFGLNKLHHYAELSPCEDNKIRYVFVSNIVNDHLPLVLSNLVSEMIEIGKIMVNDEESQTN